MSSHEDGFAQIYFHLKVMLDCHTLVGDVEDTTLIALHEHHIHEIETILTDLSPVEEKAEVA